MKNGDIDYSIIIPVYCNQGTLLDTYQKIKEKVINLNKKYLYEIIFVDDGSYDGSMKELLNIKEKDPNNVTIIKFTRNFGQIAAILAGYFYAKGKCIINISADLQDPPKIINEMLNYHFKDKYEIVVATRSSRDESFFRRITSKIAYKIMKRLSFPNMPSGGFDFTLISKKVKESVLANKEVNPFWQGQLLWTGYKIKFIPYKRKQRKVGKSKWTFSKKLKYLIDGIMSYSYFPLRLISVLGIIVSLFGFLYAIIIVF